MPSIAMCKKVISILLFGTISVVVRCQSQTYSQDTCSGVNLNNDMEGHCGASRDGLTDGTNHGPLCCDSPNQVCCTYSYAGETAKCVNTSIAETQNSGSYCHGFCTFDIFQGLTGYSDAQVLTLRNSISHDCGEVELRTTSETLLALSSYDFYDATRSVSGYGQPPPTNCTISCQGNQCDTITLSCATTPEGHILTDVTNNRIINATSPVLVMSDSNGDGTADGNDVDANWFCPSLELAYGQVPFTGLPGQSNIACDENRSYAPDSEATRALNISNFCLSNCDPDTGFVFSLMYISCNRNETSGRSEYVATSQQSYCSCEPGRKLVHGDDSSTCELCEIGRYAMAAGAHTECTACPSGTNSEDIGASQCTECSTLYIGSDDCSQPVLGIIVGCVAAAILFMLVGICYLQIQLHRERERQAKENLERTEKLLQANVDDVNLLSSGWILSKDEVKFVERLAAGSEGEVWRGTMRGRYEVAIKKVFDKKITLERNDEIRFLQRARHPRLVMFLGCGYLGTNKHDGIFVVLEFCEYGSLTSYVVGDPKAHAEKKGLPEERSWSVRMSLLDDVAEGMAYLHLHHKSVHRDLKADNVLLSMEDKSGVPRAKVADFGLSRLVEGGRSAKAIERERELKAYDDDFDDADDDADSSTTKGRSSTKYSSKGSNSSGSSSAHSTASSVSSTRSKTGSVSQGYLSRMSTTSSIDRTMTAGCGTPAYMAPEIIINLAKNVHRYGQPVDVYAFAIIMYEVLELHPAWFEKSYTHYIFQDVEEGKRPPISREADAPSTKYCTLMKKCWGSDPALRPTFDVILDVVREIRGDMARDRRLVSKSASVVPPKASAGEGSKSKTPVSQIKLIIK